MIPRRRATPPAADVDVFSKALRLMGEGKKDIIEVEAVQLAEVKGADEVGQRGQAKGHPPQLYALGKWTVSFANWVSVSSVLNKCL